MAPGERMSFAALARSGDAPFDGLLLALAAEFQAVDAEAALERLDELSRPLFGGPRRQAPRQAAEGIATALWAEAGMRPWDAFDGLFIDRVLAGRRGDPALLAALYLEVARRAGLKFYLLSCGRRWLVGLLDGDRLVAIDPASGRVSAHDPLGVHSHCAHQLADAVLCELATRFRSHRRIQEARRAVGLRLLLPLREEMLADARMDLDALD